jgi:hypothetical protein
MKLASEPHDISGFAYRLMMSLHHTIIITTTPIITPIIITTSQLYTIITNT